MRAGSSRRESGPCSRWRLRASKMEVTKEMGVEGLMTRDLREARLWRARGILVKLVKGSRERSPELADGGSIGVGR